MLSCTSPREAPFAYFPPPPWNLLFFTVESTISSPCSCSDLRFSLAKVQLSLTLTLSPHDLVLWTDCSVPFLLAKAVLVYLPTAFSVSVALRLLFHFQQAQFVQVFLLKSAPFYEPFAGLGSTNKSAVSLLFSSYLTFALSSLPCPLLHLSFYLKLCGRSRRNCLLSSPVLSGYNGPPNICFSWGTMRLMSWPDRECYLCPL